MRTMSDTKSPVWHYQNITKPCSLTSKNSSETWQSGKKMHNYTTCTWKISTDFILMQWNKYTCSLSWSINVYTVWTVSTITNAHLHCFLKNTVGKSEDLSHAAKTELHSIFSLRLATSQRDEGTFLFQEIVYMSHFPSDTGYVFVLAGTCLELGFLSWWLYLVWFWNQDSPAKTKQCILKPSYAEVV